MTLEDNTATPSRRQMLRRGAALGGAMIWTAPVVQSIGGVALADNGSPTPGGGGGGQQALSEVTFAIKCDDCYAWGKYLGGGNGTPAECATDLNIPESNGANADPTCEAAENLIDTAIPADACQATCVQGSVNSSGALTLTVPAGCEFVGWTVHDGFADGTGSHCAYKVGTTTGGRANGDGYTVTQVGSTYTFAKP